MSQIFFIVKIFWFDLLYLTQVLHWNQFSDVKKFLQTLLESYEEKNECKSDSKERALEMIKKANANSENKAQQWSSRLFVFSCGMMKLKILVTSRVYQQLFILVLLLQNSVSGQIDWAEDDDDPGWLKSFWNLTLEYNFHS